MNKRRMAGVALLLCSVLATGETANIPIAEDVAIGNDGAKGFLDCLNESENSQLAACNYTC